MSDHLSNRVADIYLMRQAGMNPDFVKAVSTALSLWDQRKPLFEVTVADAMRQGAAKMAWDTLSGRKADWFQFTDEPRKLEAFLKRALQRAYQEALTGDSRAVLR